MIKHPDFSLPGKALIAKDSKFEDILIDATEIKIQRPKKTKILLLGEKKYVIKSQITVDKKTKKIIYVQNLEMADVMISNFSKNQK